MIAEATVIMTLCAAPMQLPSTTVVETFGSYVEQRKNQQLEKYFNSLWKYAISRDIAEASV